MLSQLNRRCYAGVALAIGFVLTVALSSVPASACIFQWEFNEQAIDYTQTIIRGRPTAYEVVPHVPTFAKLTFEVEETYRGPIAETWVAVWLNSMFELPDSLADFVGQYGNDIVVGLAPPSQIAPMDAQTPAKSNPKDHIFWQLPRVVQTQCATPFMGDYTHFESALRNRGVIE